MTEPTKLNKLIGPCELYQACNQAALQSIETVKEIYPRIDNKRFSDLFVQGNRIVVGNSANYCFEDNQAIIYLTDTSLNPIFMSKNPALALFHLKNGYYPVDRSTAAAIRKEAEKKDGRVKRYVLPSLTLEPIDKSLSCYKSDYSENGKSQQELSLEEQVRDSNDQRQIIIVFWKPEIVKTWAEPKGILAEERMISFLCEYEHFTYESEFGTTLGGKPPGNTFYIFGQRTN